MWSTLSLIDIGGGGGLKLVLDMASVDIALFVFATSLPTATSSRVDFFSVKARCHWFVVSSGRIPRIARLALLTIPWPFSGVYLCALGMYTGACSIDAQGMHWICQGMLSSLASKAQFNHMKVVFCFEIALDTSQRLNECVAYWFGKPSGSCEGVG